MYKDTKDKWLYDIFLDDNCVGDQGDEVFNTKDEAITDANEFIKQALAKEYNRSIDAFRVEYYQAIY